MPRRTVTVGTLLRFPAQVKWYSRWCQKGITFHGASNAGWSSWIQKRKRDSKSNCKLSLHTRVFQRISEEASPMFYRLQQTFHRMNHEKLWVALKEMDVLQRLFVLMHNLCRGQEATARTEDGKTTWFPIGKAVRQGCLYLLICLICHRIITQKIWPNPEERRVIISGKISITR